MSLLAGGIFIEGRPLGLFVLRWEQALQGRVTLDRQIRQILLNLHDHLGEVAGQRHRVHHDGLGQLEGLFDGGHGRADDQTDPVRCGCHAHQSTTGH